MEGLAVFAKSGSICDKAERGCEGGREGVGHIKEVDAEGRSVSRATAKGQWIS